MGDTFDDKITRISERYTEKKTSKTEDLMNVVMEGGFYDWASGYEDRAKKQSGFISGKTIMDYFKDDTPLGKWENQVKQQWKDMMPQQKSIYSNPPASYDKHPVYIQLKDQQDSQQSASPDTFVYRSGKDPYVELKKHIMNKMKNNQALEKEDIAALEGFDRFRARQWNQTISREQGYTQRGPGTDSWDQRIRDEWNAMKDDKRDVFNNNFDEYYEFEAEKYTNKHGGQ